MSEEKNEKYNKHDRESHPLIVIGTFITFGTVPIMKNPKNSYKHIITFFIKFKIFYGAYNTTVKLLTL